MRDLIHDRWADDEVFKKATVDRKGLDEAVNEQDYSLQNLITDSNERLTEMYAHASGMSTLLQGQKYWDNNKQISEDLFQIYFSMAKKLAEQLNVFELRESHLTELRLEHENKNSNRGRARRNSSNYIENKNTNRFAN